MAIFFGIQNVKAEDLPSQEVIINELMWMGSSKSSSDEWIELYNTTDQEIDLSGWQITRLYEGTEKVTETLMLEVLSGKFIQPNDYFLISNYDKGHNNTVLDIKPDLVDSDVSLSNSKLQINLYNQSGELIDIADDGMGVPLAGSNVAPKASMERNEIPDDGTLAENWHTATDSIGFILGTSEKGTPRSENSINESPTGFNLQSPDNSAELMFGSGIDFLWSASSDPEGDEISYEFYLGCSSNLGITDLIDSGFTETYYVLTQEELNNCSKYYWQIIASDGSLETASSIFSFEILEPVYSDNIIVNELYPDPSGDASAEWIELFNNSPEDVDLKDWILEDTQGSVHQYQFTSSTIIKAFGFLLISRSETGITLNNDQDGVKLIKPNGIVLYTTPEFSDGEKGWSFARTSSNSWSWTDQITPGSTNIISLPEDEDDVDQDEEEEDEEIPKNTEPINMKTGDYKNYEDYLVKVTGVVVSTSGSTFYLDDGSGRVKIYIQSKTGIDKPPMQKGDVVEIIGIVNYYRGSWRILPQKQEDIKMIKDISEEAKTKKTASASTAKSSSTSKKSTASTVKARSPTSKSASSRVLGSADEIQVDSARSSFWIQFMKVFIGLAGILLIILVVKVLRFKKEKPLGGDFGDDYT